MAYRAKVTLCADPSGLHTRPSSQIAQAIRGLDARIVFYRNGQQSIIRPGLSMMDVLQASADLELSEGAEFDIICEGPQARAAFEALGTAFSTGYLAGSVFQVEEVPEEAGDDDSQTGHPLR
jgi:phosphotransferase system HPr (HPr) family protein